MLEKLANRSPTLVAVALILPFFVSIASMWQWIFEDLSLMPLWQRVAFCSSEAICILSVLYWLCSKAYHDSSSIQDRSDIGNPLRLASDFLTTRRIMRMLALGILLDMTITGLGVYQIYRSSNRALATTATIERASKQDINAFGRSDVKHKVDFDYTANDGTKWKGSTSFMERPDRPMAKWAWPIAQAIEQADTDMDIVYDPRVPKRAWAKGEPWVKFCTVSLMFITLHFCQLCTLMYDGDDSEFGISRQGALRLSVSNYPLVPLSMETPFLCLVAFFYWLAGGF